MNKKAIILVVAFIAIICTMSAGCIVSDNADINKTVEENKYEKLVIDYTIVDNTTGDETLIEKAYDFTYSGRNWHIVAQVPKYRYNNYVQERYLVLKEKEWEYEPENQRAFILDEYVTKVIEQFKTQNGELTDQELIEVLVYFVQTQIEYVEDDEQYGREYEAYPMQVLINGKGDCDCKATLMTGLFYHANYDCMSARIFPTGYNVAHRLVGISFDRLNVDSNAKSIENDGKKYYLVESTGVAPIGIGTFIKEDVDKWREVYTKGCIAIYEDNELISYKDYINREYWEKK